MILKAEANAFLFKGDVTFLSSRTSQIKPLNHLIKMKWKTDKDRLKEKDRLFSVIILLTGEKHVSKGYKAFFHDKFCPCDNTVVEGENLGTVIAIQGSDSRGSFRTTRHIASLL